MEELYAASKAGEKRKFCELQDPNERRVTDQRTDNLDYPLATTKQAETAGSLVRYREGLLCDACRQIDFTKSFGCIDKIKSRAGVFITTLGPRLETSQSCAFCKLLRSLLDDDDHRSLPNLQPYQLRAFSNLRTLREVDYSKAPKSLKTGDSVLLGLVPEEVVGKGTFHTGHRDLLEHLYRRGYICSRPFPTKPAFFSGRPIPPTVEVGKFEKWLAFCSSHHTRCNVVSEINQVPTFKVINCHTLSTEPLPPDQPYIALSYVWGAPKKTSADKSNHDANLVRCGPRVVKDAISVTLSLGFQ
jgi:hypothetical protein